MKAVQLVQYGDAVEGLELRDVDEPEASGPGEALVAVEFAPININDLMVVWGIYHWGPQPPSTSGNEGSGVVLAVGSGVDAVRPGDRVVLPLMSQTCRQRIFKQIEVHCFFEGHPHNASRVVPILHDLVGTIGPGGVREPAAAVYPMAVVKDAVEYAVRGGRVLLAMNDDPAPTRTGTASAAAAGA